MTDDKKHIEETNKFVLTKYKTLIICCNLVTIGNSVLFPVLYYMCKPYFSRKIYHNSLKYWSILILSSLGCTCIGGILAGLYGYVSYTLYNIILLYLNWKIYNKKW